MQVVVTGGAGYIGSHVVRCLLRSGHEVRVVDDLSAGRRELARAAGLADEALVVGDVGDPALLDRVLPGAEAVVHVAGRAYAHESVRDPARYFRINTQAGLTLLDGARRHGVSRLVYSSTCAVYGAPAEQPVHEGTPLLPVSPYGASKLALEQALAAYREAYGLRALALRYFNAAGASAEGPPATWLGEVREEHTRLVPCALLAAREGAAPFQVCGADYPTRDGTAERDLIHVQDLARAHVAALERLDALHPAGPFAINLGAGRSYTVREVLRAVEQVTGRPLATVEVARRPGDPPALTADASLAARVLDFHTELGLDDIVRSTWDFMNRTREGTPCTQQA